MLSCSCDDKGGAAAPKHGIPRGCPGERAATRRQETPGVALRASMATGRLVKLRATYGDDAVWGSAARDVWRRRTEGRFARAGRAFCRLQG